MIFAYLIKNNLFYRDALTKPRKKKNMAAKKVKIFSNLIVLTLYNKCHVLGKVVIQ